MHKSLSKKAAPSENAYPDKLFYKIGEVSKIAGVEPYVLRYWETEFTFLKPRKSKSGQRIYIKKDLELIFQIKELLYAERFTIEGVRKKFSEGGLPDKSVPASKPSLTESPSLIDTEAPLLQASQPSVLHQPEKEEAVEQYSLKENPLQYVKARLREILNQLD